MSPACKIRCRWLRLTTRSRSPARSLISSIVGVVRPSPLLNGSHASASNSSLVSSDSLRGRPDRAPSCSPSRPLAAARCRHLDTVAGDTPSRWAISSVETPSAAAKAIFALSTSLCGAVPCLIRRSSFPRSSSSRTTRDAGRPLLMPQSYHIIPRTCGTMY